MANSERIIEGFVVSRRNRRCGDEFRSLYYVQGPDKTTIRAYPPGGCPWEPGDKVVCHVDSLQANPHLLPEPLIVKYYSEIVLDANSEMCAGCIFGGERRLGGKKCNLYKDGLEVTKEKPIHQRIREWVNSLHARMFLG